MLSDKLSRPKQAVLDFSRATIKKKKKKQVVPIPCSKDRASSFIMPSVIPLHYLIHIEQGTIYSQDARIKCLFFTCRRNTGKSLQRQYGRYVVVLS